MPNSTRKQPSTSVQAAVTRRQAAVQEIPVPEGLELVGEVQETVWAQMTLMKTENEWRTGDLITLHQVVRLESKIREAEKVLNQDGWAITDRFGAIKPHPLAELTLKMTNQKMALLRSLGLNISAEGRAASRKAAPTVADQKAAKNKSAGRPNLLAVPQAK